MLSGAVMWTATQSSARSILVHKRYSGITGRLVTNPNYVCRRCIDKAWPIIDRTVAEVDVDGTMLDVEATFCYLGDIMCTGGGCGRAIVARCCVACGKIRKLLPVLTARHLSLQIRGKVYDACVRSATLHGSEAYGSKPLICSGSSAITMRWSPGSGYQRPKWKPQLQYPKIWHWGYCGSP